MKIVFIFLLIASCLFGASINDKNFGTATVSKVTSIYDGDTFRADIKGFPDIIGERMSIRINGIDTPEIKGKCKKEKLLALKAKQKTISMLRAAKVIELRNMKRGKYFRIVADVYVDNKSIGDALIKDKLACPYDGGHKTKDWCE